jgi:hypothetical protein
MWIDMEQQRPDDGQRVIVLIPFGMRVDDDTYTESDGWLNHNEYISHWMPINPPGDYTEIMQRPRALLPDVVRRKVPEAPDWIPAAIVEHSKMMTQIIKTQLAVRFPGEPKRVAAYKKAIAEIESERERLQQMYDERPGMVEHRAAETILDALDMLKRELE